MFIFSGALLLYAGLLALTRDCRMLPFRVRRAVKPRKDRKNYMLKLAKITALCAAAPALAGAAGFWNIFAGLFVLIAGVAAAIWLGTRLFFKEN